MLFRKAVRTIRRGWRSYLACIFLIFIGVSLYIGLNSLHLQLSNSRSVMYSQQNFADVFAGVRALPHSELTRLEKLTGIDKAQGTLQVEGKVQNLGEKGDIINLRIMEWKADNPLNKPKINKGVSPKEKGIFIGEQFANAHKLNLGDEIEFIVEGKLYKSYISSIGISPEYIYAIPSQSQLLPDDIHFGYGFIAPDFMERITGKTDLYENIYFSLDEQTEFEQVKYRLEELLKPYGLFYLHDREDQLSHAMVSMEIDQLSNISLNISLIFIIMATVILYIMIRRIIEGERTQIGTLRAFGFSKNRLLLHYSSYGLIIGIVGGLLGIVGGTAMTRGVTEIFLDFFYMPSTNLKMDTKVLVTGYIIAIVAGILGAAVGAYKPLNLPPSEAMRPAAPPLVTTDIIDKLPFADEVLNNRGRMALRNIARSAFRSGFVVVGLAFSFAIITFVSSFTYIFDVMLLDQFNIVQRYDLKAELKNPQYMQTCLYYFNREENIDVAEGSLELAVKLTHQNREENAILQAFKEKTTLYNIYDNEFKKSFEVPEFGVTINTALASKLNVGVGDFIEMTTPYMPGKTFDISISNVIRESAGASAYIDIERAWELLGIPPVINHVMIRSGNTAKLKEVFDEAEQISNLTDIDASRIAFKNMLQSFDYLFNIIQLMGMAIAFAIITNTMNIALSERNREYGSLRVLGMHPAEIGQIQSFEYRVLGLLGTALGVPITQIIMLGLSKSLSNEIFTMPTEVPAQSLILSFLLCWIVIELSNLLAIRKISKLSIVEVLKGRE